MQLAHNLQNQAKNNGYQPIGAVCVCDDGEIVEIWQNL